jgi:hypothetical protein
MPKNISLFFNRVRHAVPTPTPSSGIHLPGPPPTPVGMVVDDGAKVDFPVFPIDPIQMTKYPSGDRIQKHTAISYGNPLNFYAFKGSIEEANKKDSGHLHMAHMHIPSYLSLMDKNQTGICELFLLRVGGDLLGFTHDKAKGQFGCPQRVLMNSTDQSLSTYGFHCFEFAGMHFYPFITREYVVCYYICDAGSKEYDWQEQRDFEKLFSVAVNHPITYDATLGLFVTRSAQLVP